MDIFIRTTSTWRVVVVRSFMEIDNYICIYNFIEYRVLFWNQQRVITTKVAICTQMYVGGYCVSVIYFINYIHQVRQSTRIYIQVYSWLDVTYCDITTQYWLCDNSNIYILTNILSCSLQIFPVAMVHANYVYTWEYGVTFILISYS